ncbi:MAG: T9SS type A sorting domain-containing protein [Ignavibacteria bacterium]
MKKVKLFTVVFTVILFCSSAADLFSQDKMMLPPEQNYYSASKDGNTLNPMPTLIQTKQNEMSAEERALLRQLREARLSGNQTLREEIQNKLYELHNVFPVETPGEPGLGYQVIQNQNPPFETDFFVSTVHGLGAWANATVTVPVGAPNAGRIYVAAAQSGSGGDSCKIYYSTNGGVNWIYYTQFWFTGNTDFRANELDLEILVESGVVYLYGVAGFHDNVANNDRVVIFRWNLNTNTFYGAIMAWPGAVGTNKYFNPRICSDNVDYPAGPYIYIVASFDSTTGATRHYRMKYANIQNPTAAVPSILYPQANAGGFWWHSSGQPVGLYLSVDVAFYFDVGGTGNDRVYTVYNIPNTGQYNMYLAWSDTYGASNTGSLILSIPNATNRTRLAYNGGNRNMVIVLLRHFSGIDWDVAYYNTTTGGTTVPGWSSGYIDFTAFQSSGQPDVVGIRGAANLFRAAFVTDSTMEDGRYAGFSGGTSWNAPSRLRVTHQPVDTVFAALRAGYRIGGGNDCVIIWRSSTTFFTFASYLCLFINSISGNNNEIPQSYALYQNYPNPFNPITNIKFSIPVNGFVKLKLYDLTGREITELLNENLNAGTYNFEFDASKLSSGLYLYKLEAGDFADTKKMVLIK